MNANGEGGEPMMAMTVDVAKSLFAAILDRLGPGGLLALPLSSYRLLESPLSAWTQQGIRIEHVEAVGSLARERPAILECSKGFLHALAAIRAIEGEEPLIVWRHGSTPLTAAA